MKGFVRKDLLFSLCGLNCALCTMKLDGHCPGCGGGEGNQGCPIARCARETAAPSDVARPGSVEYCFECAQYPCQRYRDIDRFDSFITHRHQLTDMEKARKIGLPAYHAELKEKAVLLGRLLDGYNDGRHKTFFCLAVNLLELSEVRAAVQKLDSLVTPSLSAKEKAQMAVQCFEERAQQRNIILKLNKKK